MADLQNINRFALDFAALVQRYVDRQGLTLQQVALKVWGDDSKARSSHVSAYLSGTKGDPSSPTIKKFCDGLGIPFEEIDPLRERQLEARRAQARALDIPLGFLDRIAAQFGGEESFTDWKTFEETLAGKAADYHRLTDELESLRAADPLLGNRIADAEALIGEGRLEEAEAALADLRELAQDRALEGIRQLARIMTAQAEVAFLRDDLDAAFRDVSAAADLFNALAPLEGAELRNRWGERFWQHGLRRPGPGFTQMETLAQRNIGLISADEHPIECGDYHNRLGIALQEQGIRTAGEDGTRLLDRAVAAYTAALEVRTRDMPAQWAMTQNNLGTALKDQGSRTAGEDGTGLLDRAVAAYTAALEVRTREDMPAQWAMTQNNLGNALWAQGSRTAGEDGTGLLDRAVAAYTAALEVRTREDMPAQWAMTQNNLGATLWAQASRTAGEDGARLLDRAVAAYTAALEVRTREDMPVDWAETQENIAIAYRAWALRDDADRAGLLARALAAVELALEVYDPEHMGLRHEAATRLRDNIRALMAQG